MSIEINLRQATELVECFGGDEEGTLTVIKGDEAFHSGPGLYAHDEYTEHGCAFLGRANDGRRR